MKLQQSGFTLVESMITIAVAAVLLSLAIPSFSHSIKSSRVENARNELFGALIYARSEAVNQMKPISVCASIDQATCSTNATGAWDQGWIVFIDHNANGDVDGSSSDRVLKVQQKSYGVNIKWDVTASVVFDSQGHASVSGGFTICEENRDTKYARAINVAGTGRTIRTRSTQSGGALTCS